jgi:hypothetical protein
MVSGWIFTLFAQHFTQVADVGQSIKQFTNEDPNHGFELGVHGEFVFMPRSAFGITRGSASATDMP